MTRLASGTHRLAGRQLAALPPWRGCGAVRLGTRVEAESPGFAYGGQGAGFLSFPRAGFDASPATNRITAGTSLAHCGHGWLAAGSTPAPAVRRPLYQSKRDVNTSLVILHPIADGWAAVRFLIEWCGETVCAAWWLVIDRGG